MWSYELTYYRCLGTLAVVDLRALVPVSGGKAGISVEKGDCPVMTSQQLLNRRNTSQELPPLQPKHAATGAYDLYPSTPVPEGSIARGYQAIAEKLVGCKKIRIDGFVGVFWSEFQSHLQAAFQQLGVDPAWVDITQAYKSEAEINDLANPCLGGDDPLFGKRYEGELLNLFDKQQLAALASDATADCTIFYGCGAGLIECDGLLVYVDLPKSEVQFRSRAGTVGNLGISTIADPKPTYKRHYFFDWPMLNRHKAAVIRQIDWFIDEQQSDQPAIISGDDLREALDRVSHGVFRVRPWFEPGPWGGQWISELIPDLPRDVPNYAWSFELISPENGLMFDDGEHLIEASFDCVMYHNAKDMLGDHVDRFGYDFPIRFNFLDTFEGGNLSVQCHPRPEYIKEHFGEPFTQDECYYIVDSRPGSEVYLGFTEDIDPDEFEAELKRSFAENSEIDVKNYVNSEPTNKHDLFLIPGGTVHCSGINNLVLEISATTYIFTFKMYDWLRLDLEGKPRPLNIDRAMVNLHFDRKGDRIAKEFVSHPVEISQGDDWRVLHLPTHATQFYDVHRFEFDSEVMARTEGSPHVLAVVEGTEVIVETQSGERRTYSYAETFVVPAAADSYKLINAGQGRAMVVKAFLKPTTTNG